MKKYLPFIAVAVFLLLGFVVFFIIKKPGANGKKPDLVETPPTVSKVNSLPLALRPYVGLVPHANPDTAVGCNGVDLIIENLKNGEEKVEYELEYNTAKLIQGVFGRREFTQKEEVFKPLEFGTCSKGRCKCDVGITGGSLKLTFSGKEEYILKGDFTYQNVGEKQGKLTSRDARLEISVGEALPKTAEVLIASTIGLPKDLADEVLVGPYGIFVEKVDKLKKPMTVRLQSKDVVNGKVQFWDGENWKVLEAKVEGEKVSFEIDKLGVIVLTK